MAAKKRRAAPARRRRRRSNAMSVARSAGRTAAVGLKGTLMTAGGGAATYFGHKLIAQRVQALNSNPYITPGLLIAAGHFLKRRSPEIGSGLVGAGGYALGLAIDLNRANRQAQPAADARALVEPDDIRALVEPSDIRAYDSSGNVLDVEDAVNLY